MAAHKGIPQRSIQTAARLRLISGGRLFLSVQEVAAVLGVSAVTVRRAIRDGDMRHRRVRSRVLIPVEELNSDGIN